MSFDHMGLNEAISRAVHDAGYTQATEVQQRAIGPALQRLDLMVSASTGSGTKKPSGGWASGGRPGS